MSRFKKKHLFWETHVTLFYILNPNTDFRYLVELIKAFCKYKEIMFTPAKPSFIYIELGLGGAVLMDLLMM